VPVVRASLPGPPRWLPAALLPFELPDCVLVGAAPVGRESGCRRDAEPRSDPEWLCGSVHGSSRRQSAHKIYPAEKPAPVAPPESPGEFADEAADLLDGLLLALLDLPGDVWPDLAAALPEEVFDRIDRYMEARLT